MQIHKGKVGDISEKVQEIFQLRDGKKISFRHGSSNSTRPLKNNPNYHYIDISNLDRVLEVNISEMFALVEPNVPMDKFVAETLKYSLLSQIVIDFPGITVGGAIQGAALESLSFKYGQFSDICTEYEIVTANGTIVTASPDKNADLFYGTSGSYGCLGLLTLAKIKLVPAKKYILTRYTRTNDNVEVVAGIENAIKNGGNDFVDGIIFSEDHSSIVTGKFVDEGELPIKTFTNRADEWFHRHVKNVTKNKEVHEELVPVYDYFFRYDRGAFWMAEYSFPMLKVPNLRPTRFLVDYFAHTRQMYEAIYELNVSQNYFIQDIYFPFKNVVQYLDLNKKKMGIYPIWLCPVRTTSTPQKMSPHYSDEFSILLNVGIYGQSQAVLNDYFGLNIFIEDFAHNLKARKMLYAHAFYEEGLFWKIYDKDWYDSLREKYNADKCLPDIWQKTHVSEKYKTSSTIDAWKFVLKRIGKIFK